MPQVAEIAAAGADLVQQPRLAERTIEIQEVIVQGPNPLGDQAVEAADPGDVIDGRHCLTLVRDQRVVQAGEPAGALLREAGTPRPAR
jgi:hypothetical protein